MTVADLWLVGVSVASVLLAVLLIVRLSIHPFISLTLAAALIGLCTGLGGAATVQAMEQGFGDVMRGTGVVVALGLSLGAMLQHSGAAATLAGRTIGGLPPQLRSWACLAAAVLLGLPLFFETGVVLLLPIVAALPRAPSGARGNFSAGRQGPVVAPGADVTELMLVAVTGLAVVHALLPPHPGPLLALNELHANLARTLGLGLLVALPTAGVVAALLVPRIRRWLQPNPIEQSVDSQHPESPARAAPLLPSLLVVVLPVLLIAGGSVGITALPRPLAAATNFLGAPPMALLLANLLGLACLVAPRRPRIDMSALWRQAFSPAGALLLSIGAGAMLKQILVAAGLSDLLQRLVQHTAASPLLVAWALAALTRVATGSSTVATITTAGLMSHLAAGSGVPAEWLVLSIGLGSLFLSHVNDPGFWLVRGYLGTSTADTFKSWSLIVSAVAILGLGVLLLLRRLIG
jgi:GntP family gluconate:H+ symporter